MRSIVRDSSPSMQEVLDMMSFDMDVAREWCDTSGTPEIKLRGGFLERYGFTLGAGLMVTVEQGRITITIIPEDGEGQD